MPTTRTLLSAALLSLCLGGAATAQQRSAPVVASAPAPPPEHFTSPTLTRFASEAEFELYLESIRQAQRRARSSALRLHGIQTAQAQPAPDVQSDTPPEPVCTDPELCPEQQDGDVVVTGTRIQRRDLTSSSPMTTLSSSDASNPTITNNQMVGVDEGDIVKQIGQFLIVLQDGRLFVVDTRPGGRPGLALTDRADVYRSRGEASSWYDEMLVQGNRILVTAYSYSEGASELSVFRLDPAGRVQREGVFLISSNDYYSGTNYATRLVGDSLVVYTPFQLGRWGGFSGQRARGWPTVRRWLPAAERRAAADEGRPLFDATQIYRPVRTDLYPVVHTVSVCPLGRPDAGQDLTCRATAFVGPGNSELYVTGEHAYLWTVSQYHGPYTSEGQRRCSAEEESNLDISAPATLFRVPISGAPIEVAGAVGRPIDQFSMQADRRRFYSLVRHAPIGCRGDATTPRLAFLSVSQRSFGQRLRTIPDARYTPMPATRTYQIANRFTDTHFVYGSVTGYAFDPRRPGSTLRFERSPAFALPIARPAGVRAVDVPHNVIRAERAGNDIVLTGYADVTGLRISLLALDGRPRVASTVHLPKRFETEGRSHAFTSRMDADGSGLMGLPTAYYDSGRPVWRSLASDISFVAADPRRRLRSIGELKSEDERHDPSYRCEVSCVDWYGNTRAIFTGGRIFGLTGTEMSEGQVAGGRMRELRRIDLTRPVAAPR